MKTEGDGTGAATAYLSPGDVAVVDFVFVGFRLPRKVAFTGFFK